MIKILLLLGINCLITSAVAQNSPNISFEEAKKTFDKNEKEDKVYNIIVKAKNITATDFAAFTFDIADLKLDIEVDEDESSLPAKDYHLDFKETPIKDIKESNSVYLTIRKDAAPDIQKKLVLNIILKYKDNPTNFNTGDYRKLEILVNGVSKKDSLNGFNYLAYIGTNFDLVDGLKAKNLYFASNVFLKPQDKAWKSGFYLSLFGNRTMTASDSISNIRRTYKIGGSGDSTIINYREQADLLTTKVSDNLGAYMSPLIHLGGLSSQKNDIQLYYSPSLEFVWRRTKTTNVYSNGRNRDSVIVRGINNGVIDLGSTSVQYANEYNFNIGVLGFFLVHESKQISMRVHCSVGASRLFYPERTSNMSTENRIGYLTDTDLFFTGRAWITEASSGITLQAEVTNTKKNPKPYYGVTLSKAINFKNLGTFFSPITSR